MRRTKNSAGKGKSKVRRFQVSMSKTTDALNNVMRDMGAKRWGKTFSHDGTVAIHYLMNGSDSIPREYKIESAAFNGESDNYRAAQMTISALWRIQIDYEIFQTADLAIESLFQFARIPVSQAKYLTAGEGKKPWEILGIPKDAPRSEIVQAKKELSKLHHPDYGGSNDQMQEINKAADEMLEVLL